MEQRIFFVGDVHGCFDELQILLKKAEYNAHYHRLILLGDLINKGPDSFKVLSWVREQKITALLGNHEWKFIKSIEEHLSLPPLLEKLKKTIGDKLTEWLSWIKSWPVYMEKEDFLAVHGGLVPGEHPSQSRTEDLINIRYWDKKEGSMADDPVYPAWHDLYTGSKLVIYAHWARQGLKIKQNSIGLDTGCVYGGFLTGLWFPEKEVVQVSSLTSGA